VCLAPQLHGEQVRPGIETDDELRAFALDRLGEAVGEVRRRYCGHALSLLSATDDEGRGSRPSWLFGGEARS
jgi:hypothetical protein